MGISLLCLYLFAELACKPQLHIRMSTREERMQNALEILKDFQPEELHDLLQMVPPTSTVTAMSDSASGTDGGSNEQKDEALKGDAPAPVEIGESTGESDGVRPSKSKESPHPPRERKRGLPAELIDNSDLDNTKKQRLAFGGGIDSGGKPDSRTSVTKPRTKAPDAQTHRPPSAPPHPLPELNSPLNPPAMSMSVLEGATDFTLSNSLITNVKGNFNPTIFKFDGSECTKLLTTQSARSRFGLDVPLTGELQSLVRGSLPGLKRELTIYI